MGSILDAIAEWLKELLVSGIMGNLTGVFDSVNSRVGEIASDVGMTPANFSPGIFSMIRNVSESVIIPIAGLILTFIACYELIQLIIEHNNLSNFETWVIFKWIFKTFVAVTLISNCFNIVMAVFDVCQSVISRSGGLIGASTAVSDSAIAAMQATLETYDVGTLLGIYLMSFVIQLTLWIPEGWQARSGGAPSHREIGGISMTEAMKNVDPRKVDRATLRDRSTVRIDPDAPTEERIRAWIEQLGNPYVYLDGGVVVKLSFADKGETIEDRINALYLAGA